MRIVVCGAATVAQERVNAILDEIHQRSPITYLATGSGEGTDAYAQQWAAAAGIERQEFSPDFAVDGVEGYDWPGLVLLMAQPERVVVFPGRMHTSWMLAAAKRAGLPVQLVPKVDA